MKKGRELLVLATMVVLTGCYHATIETGLQPSGQTVQDNFADAWVYGLVPPKTVETMSRCPSGVARVETQLSFVNQLVGFLTLGIYTPMTIHVTCAAREEDDTETGTLEFETEASSVQEALQSAADVAVETRSPVLVDLRRL